jgi:hypothetical protein
MLVRLRVMLTVASMLLVFSCPALAQYSPQATSGDEGWTVTVYPLLAWVPTHIGVDLNLPDGGDTGGGGGGTGNEGVRGELLNTSWDGAYLGGFSATNGTWRVDVDGLWAAVGGDRPERPQLSVDTDIIYGHAAVSRRLFKALYASAGVRRMAIKYEIRLASFAPFTRKPGVWDPVVGLGLHHAGRMFEIHGHYEVGGFGVGSDSEQAAILRADFKPFRHFGVTAGYSLLHFKVSDEVAGKELIAKQTLHGPILGVGLYF